MITFSFIIVVSLLILGIVMYSAVISSIERIQVNETEPLEPIKPVHSEKLAVFYDLLKEYASLDEIIVIRKKRKQRVSDLVEKQQLVGMHITKIYEQTSEKVNLNHSIYTEHNKYYVVELLKKL